MKITLTCPASLPATQFGGILFLGVDLAREISELGNEITIYTTDLDFANNPKTFNKQLPRKEKFGKFTVMRSHVWFSIHLFFVNPGMYFQMLKDNSDVIHAIGIRSFQAFIAALIAKKKNIPLVLSDQGGITTHPDIKSGNITKRILYKLQKPMINFVISQATKISVANEYEKNIFSQLCDQSKIVIVRNGINLENILESKRVNLKEKYNIKNQFILFLGRFSKIKGIDILLNAIQLIKDSKEFSNVKLVIMGVDFGFQAKMIEMITKLQIQKNVLVIQNPTREEVIEAYRECKFLVLPSRWELSPLTPLEGFALKKTVISTNVHGIPYTIKNGENCILVEPESYKELSKAIITLLQDDAKCSRYGEKGFQLVKNICNSKAMAENTLKIYQTIIKE